MKKLSIVLLCLLFNIQFNNAQMLWSQSNASNANNSAELYQLKKGYVLKGQKSKFKYVDDRSTYYFNKKKRLITFLTNVKNVYSWRTQLKKEDYPDGYAFNEGSYSLKYDWNTEVLTVVIDDVYDNDKLWDAWIKIPKLKVEELVELLKKLS